MSVIMKALATSAGIFLTLVVMGATPEPHSAGDPGLPAGSVNNMRCYGFVVYDDSQTRIIAAMGSDGEWTIPGPLSDLEKSATRSSGDIRSCVLNELVKRRPMTGNPDTDCQNAYDWRSDQIVKRCVPAKYLSDETVP